MTIDPVAFFSDPWWSRVDVSQVTDGDTYRLYRDKQQRDFNEESYRLQGIDTWERSEPLGAAATHFAVGWFAEHRHDVAKFPFVIHTDRDKMTFNRYVADLWCSQGHHLATALREAGFEKSA